MIQPSKQLSLSQSKFGDEKVRKTDEEYLDEYNRQITTIRDRIRQVVHKYSTGFYLFGRPGTSKTHTVRTMLDTLQVPYCYDNGHLTPIGLFDLLAANKDKVIVIDDVASIFREPIALQFLLAALGQTHRKDLARQVIYKTARGTQVVNFTGSLICLSNLPLRGHHQEQLEALRDRISTQGFDPPDEAVIALCRHLAKSGVQTLTKVEGLEVLSWYLHGMEVLGVRPTIRKFLKAAGNFEFWRDGKSESHWKDLVWSDLLEEVLTPQEEITDVSRAEQSDRERRIAAELFSIENTKERLEAWRARTGKSQAAFYRRLGEAKRSGLA